MGDKAAVYDIKINQGATYKEVFHWLQGGANPPENGEPIKLYGYRGRCHVRSSAQNPGIISSIPVEIIDAGKGMFSLSLTAEQTASIPTSGHNYANTEKYTYDVEFESPNGVVERILNGKAIISPEVTR